MDGLWAREACESLLDVLRVIMASAQSPSAPLQRLQYFDHLDQSQIILSPSFIQVGLWVKHRKTRYSRTRSVQGPGWLLLAALWVRGNAPGLSVPLCFIHTTRIR
jgi:hypothetical protein